MTPFQIIGFLELNGFQGYYVGGVVRDSILNIPSKDIDIATNATPKQLLELFKNQNIKYVGANFGVTIIDDIEVATFRKDKYFGLSDKNVEITYSETIEEDLERRDFTINAMAFQPITFELKDPFHGLFDLSNRVIKFVGNPRDRILEDPNRIIRACRFLAKINGKFDEETKRALIMHRDLVRIIAKERIRKEILSAMTIKYASKFFYAMNEIEILQHIFPTLIQSYNHPHGQYHKEDVFTHMMLVGDCISTKYPLLKLTGYLHDIGKPTSWDEQNFIDHENIGSEILNKELSNLKFSNDEIKYISNATKLHMALNPKMSPKGFRRLLTKYDNDNLNWKDMIRLYHADIIGNTSRSNYHKNWFNEIKEVVSKIKIELNRENAPVTGLKALAINGDDIMEITGLKPGKQIGEILKALLDKVIDNPELNIRELLINEIKNLI